MNYLDVINIPQIRERLKSNIELALSGEEVSIITKLEINEEKYLEEIYQTIYDTNGKIIGATIFSSDVTSRVTYEQKILYTSYHDALTSFKNRRYFNEKVSQYAKKKDITISIILADVNALKVTNDAFGHDAGDELLTTVASVFKQIFASYGEIIRLGGDEFVILLENVKQEIASQLVEQAKSELALYYIRNMKVSVSFGVASGSTSHDISDILKAAEDEMYKNKLIEFSASRGKTIINLLNTLFSKSMFEELHSRRTVLLCRKIGDALNLHRDELNILSNVATFHDIGKVAIKEEILNKQSPLNEEELNEIKRHPEIGYHLLLNSKDYTDLAHSVLHHHEHYDGKGYPHGLSGKAIPIFSRIVAIGEAYDDMTSIRPYRKPLTHKEALEELRKKMGTQFDPEITQIFINSFDAL